MERTIRAIRPARPMSLLRLLVTAVAARRQRRALARLDAHLLSDVGLTPEEARFESARPVWDVPQTWRT